MLIRYALTVLLAAELALATTLMPARAKGQTDADWSACRRAIAKVEPGAALPPGLLLAIALVESGRTRQSDGRVEPWPWAYNLEGDSRFPESRAEAEAEIAGHQVRGVRSIDIGCMQINLMYHPDAFSSVDAGFEPELNVRYAAAFLRALHARTGDWAKAIASYHSGEEMRGLAYQRRVALARLGAAIAAGGKGSLQLPGASGLCAPGMKPVLALNSRGSAARHPPAGAVHPRITCHRVPRS
jgi:hypothetical protein